MKPDEPRLLPTQTDDGRNIDVQLGSLVGEAAPMRVDGPPAHAFPVPTSVARQMPSQLHEEVGASYYGLPMLKEPVWTWTVAAYFYVGGAAGGSSLLAAMLALRNDSGRRHRRLLRRARWVGALGDVLSAGLLIYDLGQPLRFLNMLRVFRRSSPMSVGSWILSGSGAGNAAAALFGEKRGLLGTVGAVGGAAGGLLGMPLAGYTAVLVCNSAIPVWQQTRKSMPLLFMTSGIAAAGSLLELFPASAWEERVLRRFTIAGKVGELAATVAVQREAGTIPRVARPLRRGASGIMLATATALTAGSLLVSLRPGRSRARRLAGAITGTLGSLLMRFAILQAGRSSARDPHASFVQQRAGAGAAEVVPEDARRPAALSALATAVP